MIKIADLCSNIWKLSMNKVFLNVDLERWIFGTIEKVQLGIKSNVAWVQT